MRISDWSSDVCSSDLRRWPADARKPARRSRSEQGGGTVMKAQYKLAGFASALAISLFAASASAEPTSMQNVMAVAIDSNPQIHQAEMNKTAIAFELAQAKGLYLARITLAILEAVPPSENTN